MEDKYAAEEKVVIEDEITKTVTERRMEIEQRLTGEPVIIEKKLDLFSKDEVPPKPVMEVPVEPIEPTELSFEHKRMSFERGVSIEQVLHEDIPIKEKSVLTEEKKMSSIEEKSIDVDVDATSLTFHEKRLSFEQGIPVKEIIIQKKIEEIIPESGHVGEHENESAVDKTEESIVKRSTTSTEHNG